MKQSDHRTRVTRYLIQKALTELLRRKPIQSISIKELCELAGINRGTFYSHYTDIYDLLAQMENEMADALQEALQPMLDGQKMTPLAVTTGLFQCIKDNSDLCTVTLGPYGDKEFAARLLNIAREQCVESYIRYFEKATPEQIEYYFAFVSSGCIGILEKWLAEGMTADAKAVAGMAEQIMRYGVGFLTQNR